MGVELRTGCRCVEEIGLLRSRSQEQMTRQNSVSITKLHQHSSAIHIAAFLRLNDR
jgi:hypothetical protein